MTNLFLIVFAILAFYIWRVTVWAGEAGGYWALITGHKNVAKAAASAAAASLSATQKAMAVSDDSFHTKENHADWNSSKPTCLWRSHLLRAATTSSRARTSKVVVLAPVRQAPTSNPRSTTLPSRSV